MEFWMHELTMNIKIFTKNTARVCYLRKSEDFEENINTHLESGILRRRKRLATKEESLKTRGSKSCGDLYKRKETEARRRE